MTTTTMVCDCRNKGLDGFHYEGAEGCLRSRAPSAVDETVKRRVALLRADGASDVNAVTGALRSLTRADYAIWIGETPEELQKNDNWLREVANKTRNRAWARLVLAERANRAEERVEAIVALCNIGVDVDASVADALSVAARACVHEKVYSGERYLTGVPQWFWICAKCHGTGTDSCAAAPATDFDAFVTLLGHIDLFGAENMRRVRGAMKNVAALDTMAEVAFDPGPPGSRFTFPTGGDWLVTVPAGTTITTDSAAAAMARKFAPGDRVSSADDDTPAEPGEPPSGPLGGRA